MPCVQEEEEDSLHPTQCFLQNLDYPEDEDSPIDLQQTAVAVMSHLDRLARPLLRADREARVSQGLMVRGEAGKGDGKEEEKERHERVSKCKTNCALGLPNI